MKKAEKPMFVENLQAELKSASAVVLVDYAGLTVKMQQDLKAQLNEIGAGLSVVKNTLFKIAGEGAGLSQEILADGVLHGPTALIITEGDPIAPLQILANFAKKYEVPQLKFGIIDGRPQDKVSLVQLSTLPSKEVLEGMVIGAIAGPMYGLVGTLNSKMQELVYILNAKVKSQN